MSTLTRHVKVVGYSPGLHGSAAAEATVVDSGPNQAREIFNAGPDPLNIHAITLTDAGHDVGEPVTIEPGERGVVKGLAKLSSPGLANARIHGPHPA